MKRFLEDKKLSDIIDQMDLANSLQEVKPINRGESGSDLFRLSFNDGKSQVLKITDKQKIPGYLRKDYPHITCSEIGFYREIGTKVSLPIPRIYNTGYLSPNVSYILMEDLAVNNTLIDDEEKRWTKQGLEWVLASYAELHARGCQLFSSNKPPVFLATDPRAMYRPQQVLECFHALYDNYWTSRMVKPILMATRLSCLIEDVANYLHHVPDTLLFNDFHPLNVAFNNQSRSAILFDWQLVGCGPAHLDICDIGFLSEEENLSERDKTDLIDHYLNRFGEVSGDRPQTEQFITECKMAALLRWGVFLPVVVRAVKVSNAKGESSLSPWLNQQLIRAIADWHRGLQQVT